MCRFKKLNPKQDKLKAIYAKTYPHVKTKNKQKKSSQREVAHYYRENAIWMTAYFSSGTMGVRRMWHNIFSSAERKELLASEVKGN